MFDTDDVLPDEVLSRHLGLDTGAEEDPEPAAEAEEPAEDDFEDTPDEGPEEDDADTDADEAGDYEPDDEGEEDEDGDEEEDDDPAESDEELENFLPEFDRKEIEKDPELKKAYKHMQAAFTRARQRDAEAARESQRQLEILQREVESFKAQLQDDAGAEEFLVQVALARPEVFERAYEQAVRLAEDEGARDLFTREQRVKAAERAAEQERLAMAQDRARARAAEIVALVGEYGADAGLEGEDFELAERFVVEKINQNRLRTGVADLTNEEIKAAVQDAQRLLKRQSKKVERRVSKKLAKERDEAVRAKVRNSRRPAPPRASKAPGVKPKKLPPPPPGVDPLDHTIDALLGLN